MRTNCADHQDDENYQVSPLEGERERERGIVGVLILIVHVHKC